MIYKWLTRITILLGLLFLYAPIVIMILFSFNQSQLLTYWQGFSFKWYQILFHDQNLLSAAWLSLRVAITASTGALILGTLTALILTRFKPRRSTLLYSTAITPMIMPDIVIGLSLLLMFSSLQHTFSWINLGFWTILAAHITFCTAYVTVVIQSRLNHVDRSIEEAALDLGAKPLKVFCWVILPQISSSLIAAWLMAFTLSIDDFVITRFVSGATHTTLPLYLYSLIKTGVTPEINATATILMGAVIVLFISAAYLQSKFTRK